MTQGIRTSLLFLLPVHASSRAPPLFFTTTGALTHTFNLLKWGSRGSQLLSGLGDQDQTRDLRDSIVGPSPGGRGSPRPHCVGQGQARAPGHLTSSPHFFLVPSALGRPRVPWDAPPTQHFSHLLRGPGKLVRAERGRSKTGTTGPREEGT